MFVFYTVSGTDYGMGMIEVLIDDTKLDSEQYVHDHGMLSLLPSNNENFGPINLGGGQKYLIAIFDKFDKIYGYTMCNYTQVVETIGSDKC